MVGQVLPGSGEGPTTGFGEHVETQTLFISWIPITCTKKISITKCQTTMAGLLKAFLQAGRFNVITCTDEMPLKA